MIAKRFLDLIIDPGLRFMSAQIAMPVDDQARVMLLTIAGVETQWQARLQTANGPARGFWQFEKPGALHGVVTHPATASRARAICDALCIPPDEAMAFSAIAWNDNLAVSFARLLLWTDANPLPDLGDAVGGWNYYIRNWRPGKPSRERWDADYPEAIAAVADTPYRYSVT